MISISGKLLASGSLRRRRVVPRSLACWTSLDSRCSWASMQGKDGLKACARLVLAAGLDDRAASERTERAEDALRSGARTEECILGTSWGYLRCREC